MDGLYEQLRIALHVVWRRRWLALGVAWGLSLAGWLVLALIPNAYESTARVSVQMQSILPTQVGISQNERQSDLARIRQTLTSTANLEQVVRRTDLNSLVSNDRDLAAEVEKLRDSIKIIQQQDNVFEISATSKVRGFSNLQNARTATGTVQTLIDLFVGGKVAGDPDETKQSLSFLDDELHRREQALQQAEQQRVAFEQRFMGVLPGQGSIEQRMAAARMELAGVDQQLMQAQGSLTALRSQLGSTPATLPGSAYGTPGAAGPSSSQLSQLEGQLAQARARGWTDQHPDVIATRSEIERLRPAAAAERAAAGGAVVGTPNPSYVSLRSMMAEKEAQVNAAQMRKNQLQSDMAQLASKQTSEPSVVAEQQRLNRDYDVLKRQYDKLLEDRENIRLRGDVQSKTDSVKFRVLDPASRPTKPETPNRPLFLTLILLVSIGAGTGAAFAAGQLQRTFPTASRLEQATGLTVLGSISEVLTDARRALRRQRILWLAGGSGALVAGYAALMLVELWQRSTVA